MLDEAERLNPGPWVQHSRYVGEAAALIAAQCDGMDAEKAYVLGLLHDIGRRVGKTNMRHILDGYTYAMENGFEAVGKICITHSFPPGTPRRHSAYGSARNRSSCLSRKSFGQRNMTITTG
jgi:HD superfamily phosphohydrolase YqeK